MKIRYTDHSIERFKERGISKSQVEEAVEKGRKEEVEGELRKSVHKNRKGMLAVIYFIQSSEEVAIVTAYWV